MSKPILELIRLNKIYLGPRNQQEGVRKQIIALDNITLTITPGERVGIIGSNGAGKTTLLRAIGGTINLTSGTVVRRAFPRMVISLGGSFLDQFTGRENIYLYGSFLGMLRLEIDALYDAIVTFSGLKEVINEPLRQYSTGMRMRLAFAVATAGQPSLICLDEIISAGDQEFQKRSRRYLESLAKTGTTVIVAHHGIHAMRQFATRVIWLKNGHMVMDSDPKTVCNAYEKSNTP